MDQDYTVDELARVCRVHIATVRRWIADGKVQAIRLPGGAFRITQAEVSRMREPVNMGNNQGQ